MFGLGLLWLTGVSANPFTLSATPSISYDGVLRLAWSVPDGGQAIIQQDTTTGFSSPTSLYQGNDGAAVITGLSDGRYFFRGRLQRPDGRLSAWSRPVEVTVKHHSLSRALAFFLLGTVVFASTVLLIVIGARRAETGT